MIDEEYDNMEVSNKQIKRHQSAFKQQNWSTTYSYQILLDWLRQYERNNNDWLVWWEDYEFINKEEKK